MIELKENCWISNYCKTLKESLYAKVKLAKYIYPQWFNSARNVASIVQYLLYQNIQYMGLCPQLLYTLNIRAQS